MKINLLFICSQNKLRSPTAEAVFAGRPGVDVDSAGLNHDAETRLSAEQLEWADLILVMEKTHRNRLNRNFGEFLHGKRIVVLSIPDNYAYMDHQLIALLEVKCRQYLS